jgi:hypothetical protein
MLRRASAQGVRRIDRVAHAVRRGPSVDRVQQSVQLEVGLAQIVAFAGRCGPCLQFKLPFLTSLCIHLPAMGFADDRREKPCHLYRFLARQLFDFDLTILGHKLADEHGISGQLCRILPP